MEKLMIAMVDGGMVNYEDDSYSFAGCPTCDYGSQYITEIGVTLTHYKVNVKTNKMYEYVISEGDMMKLFLSEYNTIQSMTEKEFTDWFKEKLLEIADEDELEEYEVVEL